MKKLLILVGLLFIAGVAAVILHKGAGSYPMPDSFIFVKGGTFQDQKSNYYGKSVVISDFYMDKFDVTQKEWVEVMGRNPSKFQGDNLPVEMVTWYDAVEYCNQRSLKEGLRPYYTINKQAADPSNLPDPQFGDLDRIKWTVTIHPDANGYRLPTEAEWEYAASGGQASHGTTYSGGDVIEDVAWYWRNAGDQVLTGFWSWPAIQQNNDQSKPVGRKKPNELGLYDMSGNVREWCFDWFGDLPTKAKDPTGSQSGYNRVWRGGGWMGDAFACAVAFRGHLAANGAGPDQGFRVVRSR